MNREDIKDKLDIKRAIEDMKTGLRMGSDVHLTISPVTQHFAVVALQEQLDRLEGCKACSSKRPQHHVSSPLENQLGFPYYNKYCKNCGRKLRGGEDE